MTDKETPHAIVLHGLARTSFSMRQMAKALTKAGYQVHNLDYPSRQLTVEESAATLLPEVTERLSPETPLYLVSHSLGGLVGRGLMGQLDGYNWTRAVFLAPPNQGSQIAKKLSEHPATEAFYEWFYGPAGQQVRDPIPVPLPPCPFGVIAGVNSQAILNPTSWISRHMFPESEKNDGTVSVNETVLEDMLELVEVEVDHTTIMNHAEVHKLVLRFLEFGSFTTPVS